MSAALPLAAFPVAGKLNKSSGFAMALVLGLAFYLAARNKPQTDSTRR